MNVGTKSILFGYHQAALHPLFVLAAWRILYRRWPRPHELAAIVTHDLGYWGSPNMDGPEGEAHPARVAAWWRGRFGSFGDAVAAEILGHSRFHSKAAGLPISPLCWADKLATALYPAWLAMLLYRLSGELAEYRQASADGRYENGAGKTARQWLLEMQAQCALLGLRGGNGHEN
ncbi:MAG: hypothetical protein KKE73_09615 [Proteobacteria bacterium]|nr:hypothetical protein [Pseudomonadota bacterium]